MPGLSSFGFNGSLSPVVGEWQQKRPLNLFTTPANKIQADDDLSQATFLCLSEDAAWNDAAARENSQVNDVHLSEQRIPRLRRHDGRSTGCGASDQVDAPLNER
jgi:hypothetical protein